MKRPRVDVYAVLDDLEPLSSRDLGALAGALLAMDDLPEAPLRHVIDLIGWVLTEREMAA